MGIKLTIEVNGRVMEELHFSHAREAFRQAQILLKRYRRYLEGKDYQFYVTAPGGALANRWRPQPAVIDGKYYKSTAAAIKEIGGIQWRQVKRQNELDKIIKYA